MGAWRTGAKALTVGGAVQEAARRVGIRGGQEQEELLRVLTEHKFRVYCFYDCRRRRVYDVIPLADGTARAGEKKK